MNLTLTRTSSNTQCTQGLMEMPDATVLVTLELPWIQDGNPGGTPDISCVPPGLYQLALHDTPKHPKTFALVNPELGVIAEPDPADPNARFACLIHIANFPSDLEGCIGLGLEAGECFISDSTAALASFKSQVPWQIGHTLEIVDQSGT